MAIGVFSIRHSSLRYCKEIGEFRFHYWLACDHGNRLTVLVRYSRMRNGYSRVGRCVDEEGGTVSSAPSAQTSGADIEKAGNAFSDGAGQIQAQVQQVAASRVTAKQAGRHFQQAGDAYQKMLDKLEGNVKAFADHGNQLS